MFKKFVLVAVLVGAIFTMACTVNFKIVCDGELTNLTCVQVPLD